MSYLVSRPQFSRAELTPGGSSGGESALISVHGSPLGIGTDIGGSIVSVATLATADVSTKLADRESRPHTWACMV